MQARVAFAHGWTGVREQRLDAYAERFAGAGLAVLVFDYRRFGASSGEPRQLHDIRRQLADWAAAIAFVRSRAEIDRALVALWGTSFLRAVTSLTRSRGTGKSPPSSPRCRLPTGCAICAVSGWH